MDSFLKHPICPRLCLPREDLLHRCVLVECMEEQEPHPSLHDGRFDLKRGAHNSLCRGRVSCLPLPPQRACGQLKGGKLRGGAEIQVQALLKIGHHPAIPCGRPPPAPRRFPATSARLPMIWSRRQQRWSRGGAGGAVHTRGPAGAVLQGRVLSATGGLTGDLPRQGGHLCKAWTHPRAACSVLLCHSKKNNHK